MGNFLRVYCKMPNYMTDTQVRYATNVENIRHNKQVEAENLRHNQATEYVASLEYAERARANRASEANARYAADQSLKGNEVKAAATEYSARASERAKRMEVTASAKQKEADRQQTAAIKEAERELTKYVEDNKLEISKDSNEIKREANELTRIKNENDFEVAKDKLKQGAEDLARKWEEYQLKVKGYELDKSKFNHTRVMDYWNNTNNSISTAVKAANGIIDAVDKVKYGDIRALGNLINSISNLARSAGGNNNG